MSRDYRPVRMYKGKPTFVDVETFNVNSWGTEFWGRVFQLADLPVLEESLTGEVRRTIKHLYAGQDLEAVRRAIALPDFKYRLLGAIELALREFGDEQGTEAAGWCQTAIAPFFSWCRDPLTVAVASDYCPQYAFPPVEDKLNYEV